ncbi:AMP-binding protein [Thalassospira tepidiphila]|jgi:acyl-coenzyme A synthetase/AMP-(fatty) acid ligase|uniref:AMP-binding protein n=1 Tax=Thalassospira tepidiphila TaxID=393657 RepID=UPI001BCC63F5|nr:AMP-binding protein [Thalassospira tepidiphila]MBS8272796.1 AMP-binding protein [Thalassospira tepidiphila]
MTGFLTALYQTEHQDSSQCIAGDRLITCKEMTQDAALLAASLPAEKRIAVHCQSAHLFTIALIAIWQRGSTVILPATDKPAYLGSIEDQFDLFLDDAAIEELLRTRHAVYPDNSSETPDPACCFAVFFTSGSTGLPKPVTKTLEQIEAEVTIQDPLWSPMIPAGARIVGLVSHQHIYGLIFRVIWPVMSGRIFTADPVPFWEMMQGDLKHGDVLITSPAHLKNLHPGLVDVARPSLIFSSGGPLDYEHAQAARAMFATCPIEIYGSTETGGIAYRRQTSAETDWTPLPGVTSRLNDKDCLAVQSPHIAGADWYQTEDKAEIEPATGKFHLLGRADRIVKIEGKRVSLNSVERRLIASELVSEAAVLLPDENDRRLGAIVVLTSAGYARLEELGSFRMGRLLRRAIAEFEEDAALPQRWRFVEQIPTDSQGKRPLHLLRTVFAPKPTEPDILETVQTDDQVTLTLSIREDLIYFVGHFPGMPILPGVTQLHWATSYASSIFGTPETTGEVSQLKFRKPILPGHIVTLELRRDASRQKVKFRYFSDGDGDLSSGILKYDGDPA